MPKMMSEPSRYQGISYRIGAGKKEHFFRLGTKEFAGDWVLTTSFKYVTWLSFQRYVAMFLNKIGLAQDEHYTFKCRTLYGVGIGG